MRRTTAKLLTIISTVVVILITLLLAPSGNTALMTVIVILYFPILIYLNYCQRCKHCGRWPRRGDFFAEYCAGCGEKLDD